MNTPPPADQILDELLERGDARLPAAQPARLQKVRYTHDAMIDTLIERPEVSQGELAAMFGYTQSWVSIVMSSDAFQARLAERKAELVDPAIQATIEERFRAVTMQSLTILSEKLAKPAASVPDNLALRCAELGAKALAVGAAGAPQAPRDGQDHLASLSNRLIDLLHKRAQPAGEIIDVTPSPQEGAA